MTFRTAMPRLGMIMGLTAAQWALGPAALAQQAQNDPRDQSPPQAPAQAPPPAPAAEPAGQAAAGAATIRGTVKDPGTGKPVIGAIVQVVGTNFAAMTEADGSYVIEGVPPGAYQVQVMIYDRAAVTMAVTLIAGQELPLDMDAAESTMAGETIVVTGTRSPEKIFDAPVTVESVSEKTLERTAGPTYLSALSNVKGIDFANAGLGDQRISMRGFTTQFNSRLITMVDGRLAQQPGNGLPQGNLLPASTLDMKAVEVVVGPASALYGPNAHTGVINVLTKSPWDESGASMSLRGGTQEMAEGAVRVAGTVNESLGFKVNAQYMRAEDFEADCSTGSPFRYNTSLCEADVLEDYHIDGFKGDASLYYRFGDWMAKAAAGLSETTGFSATNAGRNHLRDTQIQYQAVQLSNPNWYIQATRTTADAGNTYQLHVLTARAAAKANAGMTIEPSELGSDRYAARFVDASQMLDAEAQYRNSFAGVDVAAGVQGRSYMPDSGGTYLADASGQDIDATEIGGYVQADTDLFGERLRLVGAVRVDEHSNYDPQLSPKLAAVFEAAPGHKLRAGYNRAFKSPTILENYLLISGFLVGNRNGFEIRNMDGDVIDTIDPLVPEQVDALELGYKGYVGSKVFLDIVVYNSWYDDFIGPLTQVANPAAGTRGYYPDGTPVAEGTPAEGTLFTYQNFGEAMVRGADIGMDVYPADKITLSASTSFIKLLGENEDAPPLNVPTAKFKTAVTVEDVIVKDTFVRFAGRFSNAYEFRSGYWRADMPPIFVGDLTAGYTLREQNITVTGGVMNLFNNDVPEIPGGPLAKPMAFVQMTYGYPGLNF
ncbi:MAG TPA: TonB-dependent receptor [Haliangium sp.]|nr:TonB-dependent receptor [Haliangium sp.]